MPYYPHTQKEANNYSDWGSHARGCASKLQNKLNEQYEVTRFVQPGAGIRNVITVAKSGTSKLTKKKDMLILGSN
jgi:hypothetical protein